MKEDDYAIINLEYQLKTTSESHFPPDPELVVLVEKIRECFEPNEWNNPFVNHQEYLNNYTDLEVKIWRIPLDEANKDKIEALKVSMQYIYSVLKMPELGRKDRTLMGKKLCDIRYIHSSTQMGII